MSDLVDQWKVILFGSTIVLLYQVIKDFKKSQLQKPQQKIGVKICLTGGTCGGVTQGIQQVTKLFGKRGIPTYIVPQAATILGSGGGLLNFNNYNEEQIINFQYTLMKLQIGLENIMTNISNIKVVQQPVILCDRGLMDGKAYMNDFSWKKMLARYNVNQKDLINRYGFVIHMVTIADGNPQLFNKVNEKKQSPQQAIKMDNLIKKSWQKHPRLYVIGNEFVSDFEMKKCFLANYIHQNILLNVFGEGRLRKQNKIVQQGYYTYIQRKQKLRKREMMKRQRKVTQKIE